MRLKALNNIIECDVTANVINKALFVETVTIYQFCSEFHMNVDKFSQNFISIRNNHVTF